MSELIQFSGKNKTEILNQMKEWLSVNASAFTFDEVKTYVGQLLQQDGIMDRATILKMIKDALATNPQSGANMEDVDKAISKQLGNLQFDIALESGLKQLPIGNYLAAVLQAGTDPVIEWKRIDELTVREIISKTFMKDLVKAFALAFNEYHNYEEDIDTAPDNETLISLIEDMINDETRPIKASLITPSAPEDKVIGTKYWLSQGLQGTLEVILIEIRQWQKVFSAYGASDEIYDRFVAWEDWIVENFSFENGIFSLKDFVIEKENDGSFIIKYTYPEMKNEYGQDTDFVVADTLMDLNKYIVRNLRKFTEEALPNPKWQFKDGLTQILDDYEMI